jgi:hypothetical protein
MMADGATYRPVQTRGVADNTAPDPSAGVGSRLDGFSTGVRGDASSAAGVGSEIANSARYNAMVPRQVGSAGLTVRPTSVLQSLSTNPGGLGMSAGDSARRMYNGQYLGSVVGTSESSFEPSALLRMSGQDSQ